jgi:Undecaprenyl-phosphate glucose phosphotransferase
MLKQHSKFFEHLMLLGDLAVIAACWLLAYGVRFLGPWAAPGESAAPVEPYLLMLGPILLIWAAAFKVFDLYRPRRISTHSREVWDIAKASTAAVLILMAVSFLYRDFSFSRRVFFLFWIAQIVALSLMRALFREVLRSMRKRNYNLRYGLVIGTGESAQRLTEVLQSRLELGVRIVGLAGEDPALVGRQVAGVTVLGMYEEVASLLGRMPVDIVFIALPLQSSHRLESILAEIGDATVDIKLIPDFYRYVTLRGAVEEFQGMPVISLRDTPLHGWNRLAKRVQDLAVASVALFLLWPLLALIALAIKLTTSGPILYRQERMGFGGTTFTMLKFRTMRSDHEGDTVMLTSQDDPRVTPVGRWLRRASLDELPQLWNVFCGEMSIVGPRPERPWVVNELRKRIPGYMLKHHIQAGITGWAQVNGWRGNTSIEKRLEYDLYYIEHWSLWFDLKIMLMTLWRGFIHRHAY